VEGCQKSQQATNAGYLLQIPNTNTNNSDIKNTHTPTHTHAYT